MLLVTLITSVHCIARDTTRLMSQSLDTNEALQTALKRNPASIIIAIFEFGVSHSLNLILIVLLFCDRTDAIPYIPLPNEHDYERVHQETLAHRKREPIPSKESMQELGQRARFHPSGGIRDPESISGFNKPTQRSKILSPHS
jgi:hypothetical protein